MQKLSENGLECQFRFWQKLGSKCSNVLENTLLAESVIYFFVLLARQLAVVVGPAVPGRGGPARPERCGLACAARPARPAIKKYF